MDGGSRMNRKQRRRMKPRRRIYVKHWHSGHPGFTLAICLLHSYQMLDRGEYGREYPNAVCYECLPAHETFCPMGNPDALVSWLHAGNPLTCICPGRLRELGLQIVTWQPGKGDLPKGRRRLAIAAQA